MTRSHASYRRSIPQGVRPVIGTGRSRRSARRDDSVGHQRDAGGNRTHFDRVAAGCLAIKLQRQVSSSGVEPDPRPSQGRMPSTTPRGQKHPAEESNLVLQFRRLPCHPSHPQGRRYPDLESNQDLDLRRVQCLPLHHRDNQRADGWIRTSMGRFTGPLPFSIEPRRPGAGAHRFELCRAALETACSPRSTLLFRVSEGN